MKVLLVNKFHYLKGGSETYYFGLGELLKKHGCQVIYFSMKDERNKFCLQEKYFVDHIDFNAPMNIFQTAKTALKMLYSFEAKQKFERLILDEKPDIIHLNIFQSQLTGSIVDVAKKYHIPLVYTAHDLKCLCPNYQMLNHGKVCEKCLEGNYVWCFRNSCMKDSKAKSLLATLEAFIYKWRRTYQKIDLFITPSAFYKKKIEEAGIANCPVVHLTNFLPDGTEYTPHSDGEYFLYFGRLSREKGILTLIHAFAKAGIDKKLYIVGTGPEEEKVKSLIKKLGCDDMIRMLGFKSGQELNNIVNHAIGICLPSEWYENGPYSIMEAQAAGKPVIVSNYGGLPELVENGITGYIVKPNDIQDLCNAIQFLNEHIAEIDSAYITRQAQYRYNANSYCIKLMDLYHTVQAT